MRRVVVNRKWWSHCIFKGWEGSSKCPICLILLNSAVSLSCNHVFYMQVVCYSVWLSMRVILCISCSQFDMICQHQIVLSVRFRITSEDCIWLPHLMSMK